MREAQAPAGERNVRGSADTNKPQLRISFLCNFF
jgi:hypothetical protein